MEHKIEWMDGEERNRLHPDTFEIPSPGQKKAIYPGDYVKIGAEFPDGGERFWVMVHNVSDNGILTGAVANALLTTHLKFDDIVKFERRHILTI